MEPQLTTDPTIVHIQEQLAAMEPIFHHPELGSTRADYERMMEPEFWEVGASGRRYGREFVLQELERRAASPQNDPWQADGFHCVEIAADNYLLTYTLRQDSRVTRRATIWRKRIDGWKILYHQGTVASV